MSEAAFDPSEGVEPGAEGASGDAPGVVDPEPSLEASEPTVAEPAAPGWAPSQEDWQALTGTVQQLAQANAPAPPPPPAAPAFLQVDPDTGESLIDPNGLQEYINFQIQNGVQARIGQYEPIMNQTVADRGEQLINDRFTSLASELPGFDPSDGVARDIAEGLAPRLGDPNAAMTQAAQRLVEHDKRVSEKAVEQYKQTLSNIGNAPREPGATGAGVESSEHEVGPNGKVSYGSVTDRWIERNSIPT